MMKRLVVVFLTLLAILFLTMEQGEAFDCEAAKFQLFPCLEFISVGGDPSSDCCNAIKDLKSSTQTIDDRHDACECFKAAARNFPGVNENLAASLPKRCGVDVEFPITLNIKCNELP